MPLELETEADPPVGVGLLAGVAVWLLGYLVTYGLVASRLAGTELQRVLQYFQGAVGLHQAAGWVYYNTHLVTLVYHNVPPTMGPRSTHVGIAGGFPGWLYLLPVTLLVLAGALVAARWRPESLVDGAVAGLTVLPGYLLCSTAGVFVVRAAVGPALVTPGLFQAMQLAGIVYPVLFACLGGIGVVATREATFALGLQTDAE